MRSRQEGSYTSGFAVIKHATLHQEHVCLTNHNKLAYLDFITWFSSLEGYILSLCADLIRFDCFFGVLPISRNLITFLPVKIEIHIYFFYNCGSFYSLFCKMRNRKCLPINSFLVFVNFGVISFIFY